MAWENGRLPSQRLSPPFAMEKVQLSLASQRQKPISRVPEFLIHFKVQSFGALRQLLSGLIPYAGILAFVANQKMLSISGPFLEPACEAHMAMSHVAAGAAWSHVPEREST